MPPLNSENNTLALCGNSTVWSRHSTSEAEERLILVQRGYYNNPVPAFFSTSHLLILILIRINISRLWTIVSRLWTIVSPVVDYYYPVVDYYNPVVDYYKLVGLL